MANIFKQWKEDRKERLAEERRANPKGKMTRFQLFIRIIVGGYLIYLTVTMFKDPSYKDNKVLTIVAGVVFVLFGIYFIYWGLKKLIKHEYFDPRFPEYEDTEEAKAEEAAYMEEQMENASEEVLESKEADDILEPGEKTLSQLAKLTSRTQISEEEQETAFENQESSDN